MARRTRAKPKTAQPRTPRPIEADASMVHGTLRRSIGPMATKPKTQLWEGLLIALIGLLGLLHAFGLMDLTLINWPVLSSVILLVLGLVMVLLEKR